MLAVGAEAFGSNASLGGSTGLQDWMDSKSISNQIGFPFRVLVQTPDVLVGVEQSLDPGT